MDSVNNITTSQCSAHQPTPPSPLDQDLLTLNYAIKEVQALAAGDTPTQGPNYAQLLANLETIKATIVSACNHGQDALTSSQLSSVEHAQSALLALAQNPPIAPPSELFMLACSLGIDAVNEVIQNNPHHF